jgi:small ligand-binding sensory domain FIST
VPDARRAAVEAADQACDELAGEAPSLAVPLASRWHAEKAVEILKTVQEIVEAPTLIGCVGQAIVAGRREIEDEPAVADRPYRGPQCVAYVYCVDGAVRRVSLACHTSRCWRTTMRNARLRATSATSRERLR